MKRNGIILIFLFSLWLALVLHVRPNLADGGHDAILYLRAGECFFQEGFHCSYTKEPFYPVFIAMLLGMPLSLAVSIPLFQSAIFLGAAFFLFCTVFPERARTKNLSYALLLGIVPTFLIPLNGSVYTESISASLVMALVACLARYGHERASWPWRLAFLFFAVICIFSLNLAKGAFPMVHYAFAGLLLFVAMFSPRRRGRLIVSAVALVLATQASAFAWRTYRGADRIFERGGAVLFGRTEFAQRFDFSRDTAVYLLNGFSESACQKFYGLERCQTVFFGAENNLGNSLSAQGVSDEKLYHDGLLNLTISPLRQLAFVPMEWSKFVFHHTTTGFATLTAPVVGDVFHSVYFVVLLKLGNLALYILCFCALCRHWRGHKEGFAFSLPLLLVVAYMAAYLAVYGFVTTVIRMAYPVAPLLFVLAASGFPMKNAGEPAR